MSGFWTFPTRVLVRLGTNFSYLHTSGEVGKDCTSKLFVVLAKFDVKNGPNRQMTSEILWIIKILEWSESQSYQVKK